ncbi:hypothetical protein ACTFQF_19165 [Aliivibrio fischeri]|uniref:hypothetical protein n=1 Tax=Aliivibrio fischeri TaxID=668 RepID=UPI0007C51F1B|nr:hypothetical protein [Aliivibrio fischeri]MBP3139511.1 hypothetical protein [Aliivibrio fischeri]MBP3155101.1 hypothetical protein [Aliivibrio fischeri]MCE7573273.1 hypothetical protein [Aliivibrio fischeri]MUK93013.1 hypothetical protein [Aliivibrio fischeri]
MRFKKSVLSLILLISFNSNAEEVDLDLGYNKTSSHTYIGYLSSVYSTKSGECGILFYGQEQQSSSAFQVRWDCSTKGGGRMFQQALSSYYTQNKVQIGTNYTSKNLESIMISTK